MAVVFALVLAVAAAGSVSAVEMVAPGAEILQFFADRGVSAAALSAPFDSIPAADRAAILAVLRTGDEDAHAELNRLVMKALCDKAFSENVQASMVLGDTEWKISPGSLSDWE